MSPKAAGEDASGSQEDQCGADSQEDAALALALMSQDWRTVGLDATDPATAATADLETLSERLTALLAVRLAAVAAPLGTFPDLSIAGICRKVRRTREPWPAGLTAAARRQLRLFVARILAGYNDNPYHGREHAYHVTVSACRLMDLFLDVPRQSSTAPPACYGLRHDALLLFVVAFSALIHDVEHQGLPNRQLALEKDRLAIMYNDQSVAEHWSLYVAFAEFLKDDYADLRRVLFTYVPPLAAVNGDGDSHALPTPLAPPPSEDDLYNKFRRHVINLVLGTDIASPERTQIGKSKWKEAFGDPYETLERKVRAELLLQRRASIGMAGKVVGERSLHHPSAPQANRERRGSNISDISFGLTRQGSDSNHTGSLNLLSPEAGIGEDEDSISMTPENSERAEESLGASLPDATPHRDNVSSHKPSMGYGLAIPDSSMRNRFNASRFERRLSAASGSKGGARYRQRLGILRSLDLSGEFIEPYQRAGSIGFDPSCMSGSATVYTVDVDSDLPDELKATVVMETIMTASDVAHNLQGFDQMKKWSNRLYLELRKAYVAKRGVDCSPKWFENQIGFLESYLLPLARKLEDTGVFGDTSEFADNVELNRDLWLMHGQEIAEQIINEGMELYPEPDT